MRIAVVGATGRIGAKLTENLLAKGHSVKVLSRGGPALDALVAKGAEPFLGSFDTGDGELSRFFEDADAAFLMVKTLWADEDFHGHYPAVALRFFDALRDSPVKLAVSLTGMGSEVSGNTGHFQGFHILDQILNRLRIKLVHLQGGWFMEDLSRWADAIAQYDRIGFTLAPDVKAPWVSIQDLADFAAEEFGTPTDQHRAVKQLDIDYTMAETAAIIGRALGREVDYRFVDPSDRDIETVFRERFGTLDRWVYDKNTAAALNDGRVKFRDDRPALPTTMEEFVKDTLKPLIEKARTDGVKPETFLTWCSQGYCRV